MAVALKLKSVEFRREREATWAELDRLVGIVEKRSVRALSAAELARLPVLYRATLSSLSVARAVSLDRNLTDYLESLAARAYFCVYGTKRHLREALSEFFLDRFPAALRRLRVPLAISALLLLLGVAVGYGMTMADENRFYAFVSEGMAQGRGPTATTAELREPLYHDAGVVEVLTGFASFLFRHNATIAILSFALGFAAGLPTIFLVFTNGLMLGAFAALYQQRGLSVELWAWLLPHGITELSALVVCGAAGLALAQSLLFPGVLSRLDNFTRRGREAGVVVVGGVIMLFFAALLEGLFRQLVKDVTVRYLVAGLTVVLWTAYFVGTARRARGRAA
jgi:uncharacterized membrane protein SpoIIM required for sporulation